MTLCDEEGAYGKATVHTLFSRVWSWAGRRLGSDGIDNWKDEGKEMTSRRRKGVTKVRERKKWEGWRLYGGGFEVRM